MRRHSETPSPARYTGAPGRARYRTVSALSCAYRERYGVLLADLMSHRSIHPVSRLLADGTSPSSTYCRPSTPREDQMRTLALVFSITVSSATSLSVVSTWRNDRRNWLTRTPAAAWFMGTFTTDSPFDIATRPLLE